MDLLKQYNRWAGENKNLISKALTSASGSGGALVPQHLEEVISNAVPRISPELAMITPKYDAQSLHEFNRMTALGGIGGAMGESATTPTTQPVFTRASVQLKVIRRKGATTNFLVDSSKRNIDAAAANIEAQLTSHVYDVANYIVYGNGGATSNAYEFSGLDTFITTNRTQNARGGAVPTDLSFMDNMLDANFERQGMNHRKAFMMSPQMLSKVSRLLTNVRLNQGLSGALSQVDIPGGWRLNAYRDVPIIVSGAMRPKTTMGVVTPSFADAGGTILDNTERFFQVAAVTRDGEEIACAEVSQDVGAGGAGNVHTIILTFAANVNAYRYKVYVGSTTGTCVLKHVVPGFTYDANGTITGTTTTTVTGIKSWTSDANGNVTTITFLSDPATAGAEVATGCQADVPLTQTGGISPEYVFLWDLDEFQGIGRLPYTNQGGSQFNGLVTIEDLARTDDFLPFLIKSYCALADSFEACCSVNRGLRVS
jgi:hypothetical protein